MSTSYRICERDGFPIVKVNDHTECIAEYLDRHIGQKEIVDVVKRGDTIYYVFENGYEIPMLCFCCGQPLEFKNLEKSRRNMRGRRLESMTIGSVELDDGTEMLQFVLEFSKKGSLSQPRAEPVSIEVAAQMRHPDRSSQKRQEQDESAEPMRRRRRRRRRR
ncbi:MAG: hypothetical protein MAG451_00019 [Anaerolineales bacterium]|nr:hypothetical protein [Anaerolineales bacterium]